MIKPTILIASTNKGKVEEIRSHLNDLPFKFISLNDLKKSISEPDEPFDTTYFNALQKAEHYARKTQLLTIAEDTALYVDSLGGLPGIKSKRFGATAEERNNKLLKLMSPYKGVKRYARFETSVCLFDPKNNSVQIFAGQAKGNIASKIHPNPRRGMSYDAIFYYPPLKKYFADLTVEEKNNVSHRGQAITKLKLFLINQSRAVQLIVPVSLIIKDKKILLVKRRDTRKEFNDRFEFPGGGVEYGEGLEECLKRETLEETGYRVKTIEHLPKIFTNVWKNNEDSYQVYLVLYICNVVSGKLKLNPTEHSSFGWYTFKQMMNLNLIPLNRKTIEDKENKKILFKYID